MSPDLISRVTQGVVEELKEWQQHRPLDAVYPILCHRLAMEGLVEVAGLVAVLDHPRVANRIRVTRGHNVLITGATGYGKSFVACALANAALRQGHTALYVRTSRLLEELARVRADGRYVTLASLARVSLLVLDDYLLSPAPVEACRDLLEVIEDRSERRATAVASQLPVDKWHAAMADPTLAEAILDRLCAASHRIAMKGPSQRRRQPDPPDQHNTPVAPT